MEMTIKTQSRFLRKNEHFFRQINATFMFLLIYYIKPPWKNANSNFSRNFAQGFSMKVRKGGSKVQFQVERPGEDG